MSQAKETQSDLFIVDNSDSEWKVASYLREWAGISSQFDIATAYFEIGALLALDGEWQKLEKIRILMGDEVSRRTRKAFEEGLAKITEKLDASLEAAKEEDDFLSGVPAIVRPFGRGKSRRRSIERGNSTPKPTSRTQNSKSSALPLWWDRATSPTPDCIRTWNSTCNCAGR